LSRISLRWNLSQKSPILNERAVQAAILQRLAGRLIEKRGEISYMSSSGSNANSWNPNGSMCRAEFILPCRRSIGFAIVVLLIAVSSSLRAQESKPIQLHDSTEFHRILLEPNPLPVKLSLYPSREQQNEPVTFRRFSFQSSILTPRQFAWDFKEKLDLTAPLKLELADQEKHETWRAILGSIQVGGVAYLVYKHFKK
jgi:hypothetical protein